MSFAEPGQLDPTFANGGLLTLQGKPIGAIAKQPDGKLLMGNREFIAINIPAKFTFSRYNVDGSIDNSFGNGQVVTDFNGGSNSITAIAVQPNGKIVVAGYRYLSPGGSLVVARYNSDGTLDNNFDADGKVNIENFVVGPEDPYLAIQSDGKIVAASYAGIIRLNENGGVDNSFGTLGRISLPAGTTIAAIAIQSDNKLVAVGTKEDNFVVNRYNANGTPDNDFDGDGQVITDFGYIDHAVSVAVQANNQIVVSGNTTINNVYQLAVARYNSNGTLDNGFDGDGKLIFNGGPGLYNTVLLQADGKIVVAGGGTDFSVARFNSNGVPDASFGQNGSTSLPANNHRTYGAVISGADLFVVGTYYYSSTSVLAAFALENITVSGLSYRYYTGDFNTLPEFNALIPVSAGLSANVDISARPAGVSDHFAFVWEGYINIQTPGTYTFETVSDDGSKFYFNKFYSAAATALLSNDGLHAAQSVTGSVNISAPGRYPIAITYFEKDGGEAMQLYWTTPGGVRQLVPNAVLTPKVAEVDHVVPSVPQNVHSVYSGRTFIKLDWENSTDDRGVAGYNVYYNGTLVRTTSESYAIIENLSPNSQAYVVVRAVDSSGNMSFNPNSGVFVYTATAGLSYKFFTNVSFGRVGLDNTTPARTGVTPNVDISIKPSDVNEDYAFLWEGYINIPTPGTYTFETISDDGSRLYFNTPYASVNEPLVDNFENNGLHAPVSVLKTIYIPSAGLYPLAVTYNQYGGGQTMQLYWQGPGIPRQAIPNSAFTDDSKPGSFVQGLNYKYFEGNWSTLPDFNALTAVQTGQSATVDITKRPAGKNDNFAFVWEGYITIPVAGDYTFETISDDGSKLYFNSKYIASATATVNNDGLHAANSVKTTVSIQNPGTYPISITFFESTGDQKMEAYWSGPFITRQLIPTEVLSPNPSQLINRINYKTYANFSDQWSMLPDFTLLTPAKTGGTQNISLNTAKIEGRDDGYGITWEGFVYLPAPGSYTFETISDDGSKLYFNNLYWNNTPAVVSNDGIHAAKSESGTVSVMAAGIYPIAITYFEQYGGQAMEVYYSGPGIPRQKIPDESFALIKAPAFPLSHFPYPVVFRSDVISSAIATQELSRRSVYPNPFNETVTVEFDNNAASNDINISLFDLNGRKVFASHPGKLPAGNNIIRMDLSKLKINDGVFIIQVQKNGIVWKTAKVVKMKR